MKHYVITMSQTPQSVKSAERCIESGKKYGLEIHKWEATTPNEMLSAFLNEAQINVTGFMERYSRLDNCAAAFHSHWSLWKHCTEIEQEVTIFEHDAVVVDNIPEMVHNGCISLGKPSYGKFVTPSSLGVNPLTSKPYFPGAHAYRVAPKGAELLIAQARMHARPTDVFLNREVMPWLQEYYPWPVECRDSFTTIQKTEGCLAKHNYNNEYKII